MIKRAYISIVFMLACLTSCTSYYKLKPKHFDRQELLEKEWLAMQEFDVFTFNICESYEKNIDPTERFFKCPIDFFEISAQDSIKKVEELYLLVHKNSNLVVYMTTFSHKYIAKQKGFLNSPSDYKKKFYLRDTEYIYVGKIDVNDQRVLFERQKKKVKEDLTPTGDKKIVLYYKEFSPSDKKIEIETVNIETVENENNPDEKIMVDKVFSVPFNFKLKEYKLYGKKSKNQLREIEKIHFQENSKGHFEVLFKVKGLEEGYRFPSRKVLYFTK